MKKALFYLHHPLQAFVKTGQRTFMKGWSDDKYLKTVFKSKIGRELDLDNPKTFNEKLQWLKLYDRKPIYTKMVDKAEAKKIVAEKIGEEYIIPTLGVYEKWDDIDFDALPDSFVIKCTHNSGGLIVVKDKSKFNRKSAKKKIEKRLKTNYFYGSREWPYKNVKPRIIIEKYVESDSDISESLIVYKIFNFNGQSEIIQTVLNDKRKNESINYYDTEWNKLDLKQNFPNFDGEIKKPKSLEKILSLARTLSQGVAFLRTDFYEVNGKILFSEFTFYSDSGLQKFYPEEWDYKLGELIKLPNGDK
ncbi:MAG: ATP-grasp fold amidoligase family protein [Clostridia bacterium]|nr:ATP-grasp fold amidoligase family protein [Clostridia bacterium]